MSNLKDRLREPLSTIDKRIVTALGLLFITAFALVNHEELEPGMVACAQVHGYAADVGPRLYGTAIEGNDSSVHATTAYVCPYGDGSKFEQALGYGAVVPTLAFSAIALLLLCYFLWGAVRPGLHSPVTPGRLRTLGWFVLIGGPVSDAVHYFFEYELASSLIKNTQAYRDGKIDADYNGTYWAWMQELQTNFPWWCVFAGASALVVAKLLRIEVRMAEELEGTI